MFEILFKSCTHDKITPNMIAGYCPDCGKYIENHWYISRCGCCGVKQKSVFKKQRIVNEAKFCRNCGSNEFLLEELNCLDISNLNYAVLKKQVKNIEAQSFIKTWVEQGVYSQVKLLSCY